MIRTIRSRERRKAMQDSTWLKLLNYVVVVGEGTDGLD
jgi:hypothetical protein